LNIYLLHPDKQTDFATKRSIAVIAIKALISDELKSNWIFLHINQCEQADKIC